MLNRLSTAVVARIKDALRQPGVKLDYNYMQLLANTYNIYISIIYRYKSRIYSNIAPGRRSGGLYIVII